MHSKSCWSTLQSWARRRSAGTMWTAHRWPEEIRGCTERWTVKIEIIILIFFLSKKRWKWKNLYLLYPEFVISRFFSSRGRKIWFVKARVRYIGGSLHGGVLWGFLKGKTRGGQSLVRKIEMFLISGVRIIESSLYK